MEEFLIGLVILGGIPFMMLSIHVLFYVISENKIVNTQWRKTNLLVRNVKNNPYSLKRKPNKYKMKTLYLLIRILLMLVLSYFIYKEAGIATLVFAVLMYLGSEVNVIELKKLDGWISRHQKNHK